MGFTVKKQEMAFYKISELQLMLWESDLKTIEDECTRPNRDIEEDIAISRRVIKEIREKAVQR